MTRNHVLVVLAVIAVPVIGWFGEGWSGATTLAVYWFETVDVCLFVSARALLHQRMTPRYGHFRYSAPEANGRSSKLSLLFLRKAVEATCTITDLRVANGDTTGYQASCRANLRRTAACFLVLRRTPIVGSHGGVVPRYRPRSLGDFRGRRQAQDHCPSWTRPPVDSILRRVSSQSVGSGREETVT